MGDDIAQSLSAPLAGLALVPVEAALTTAGSRRVLRVLVDRDVSGLAADDGTSRIPPLSLDEVAEATRVVGDALDQSDLMGQRAYTLEVSSPGVGRPLEGYAALRRNVGRLVALSMTAGDDVTGRVRSVTPDQVVLEVPPARRAPAHTHTVPLDQVTAGRVQVEFSRADDDEGADT